MDREAVKLGQDLAPMDRGNGEERVRSRRAGRGERSLFGFGN